MAEKESYLKLFLDLIEEYSKNSVKLLKLKTLDKVTDMASYVLSRIIVFAILFMFLLMVSIAVGFWLGSVLGQTWYGFLIVAGFYGLVSVPMLLFSQKWISNAIGDALLKSQVMDDEIELISVKGIKDAIKNLEIKHSIQRNTMIEMVQSAYQRYNPLNILKSFVSSVMDPNILSDFIPSFLGIGAGFLSRKINNSSGGKFKKILLSMSLYGLSRFIFKNHETNKIFGKQVFNSVFNKN